MKKTLLLSLIILLLTVVAGCQIEDFLPGEEFGTTYGALTGTIIDEVSGVGLWSGTVQIAGKSAQIKNGKFSINNIPVGVHNFKVIKEFYQTQELQISITNTSNIIQVKMTPIFNAEDLDLFARMVHAEARGEPYKGQVAVAASILNRVRHRNYPNTLRGVLTQRTNGYAQYSPIDDGSINIPADQSAKNAVRDALAGWDPSLGATGFFNPMKVTDRTNWVWQQIPIIDIGNHRFFRARLD